MELLRLFFSLLPQRTRWHLKAADPAQFIIDETFGVPGVGTVVAGERSGIILSVWDPGFSLRDSGCAPHVRVVSWVWGCALIRVLIAPPPSVL